MSTVEGYFGIMYLNVTGATKKNIFNLLAYLSSGLTYY